MNLKAEMARIAEGGMRMMVNDQGLDLASGVARVDMAPVAQAQVAPVLAAPKVA